MTSSTEDAKIPRAHLELSHQAITAEADLSFCIVNDGSLALRYGAEYRIDIARGAGWAPTEPPEAFGAWAATVSPEQRSGKLRVSTQSLTPGHYRLSTTAQALRRVDGHRLLGGEALLLSGEFDVLANANP